MTDWIRAQKSTGSPDELGPLQLAWLGDAIWELHQRLRRCSRPGRSRDLHASVVLDVRASSQAMALQKLEPYLTDLEKMVVKRGRNKAKRGPKAVDPATYGQATGFEAMVGWLFLKDPERLALLFDQLEDIESDPSELLMK